VRTDAVFDLPVVTGDLPASECVAGKPVTSAHVREALDILATARDVGEGLYQLISEVHLEAGRDIVFYTAESGVPVVFGHGDVAVKLVTFDEFWKQIVRQRGAAELTSVDLRYADQVVVRWQTADDAVAQ
jgi:cell division septal protein FtsQ